MLANILQEGKNTGSINKILLCVIGNLAGGQCF